MRSPKRAINVNENWGGRKVSNERKVNVEMNIVERGASTADPPIPVSGKQQVDQTSDVTGGKITLDSGAIRDLIQNHDFLD